jgi:hypothetical protein
VNLCDDCLAAERDPLHSVFRFPNTCCLARAVMEEPTDERRRLFARRIKATSSETEWRLIRDRLDVLIAREAA